MPEEQKALKLQDVWRTCNKIRAAIFRTGLNLWDYYKPLDPENNSLISEVKFVSVLCGPLKGIIGLSDKEICELADYFRVQDGRILYRQFCEVIHDSVPDFSGNKPFVTGLEWEDPLHVNVLSSTELRKLSLIITRIAVLVNKRKLVLRPYFQDYELIAKNVGTVTYAHFGRVLKFLGIVLGSEEFCLLVKRFSKDSYTINYVAFVKAIGEAQDYMERCGMLDLSGKLLDQFPGRVITAELPKLPRPEIGKVDLNRVFGKQMVFHPVTKLRKEHMSLTEVIRRIQRHIFEHRIRISEFFKDFDPLNDGKVTVSQFRRGLDALQVSSLGRLYIAETDICSLITLYKDPNDPDRVCWRTFEDDINQVFTVKELEKLPNLQVISPPKEVEELVKRGTTDWQCEKKTIRELCENTLLKVRRRIEERRILLKQFFQNYDKHNHGHVSRAQMRQVLSTAAVLLSPEEELALEQRYNDDLGFNYFIFLQELEAKPITQPLYDQMFKQKIQVNAEKVSKPGTEDETNVVLVLAKIKAKVVRERIKVSEFLKQYDTHNELNITMADFVRGLDQLRCNLSSTEVDTIAKIFKSPMKPGFVDYARFAECVEEAVAMGSLERAPLIVPIQHIPSEASSRTFLNFDERYILSQSMDKLCTIKQTNLEELFADYDKENVGTVTKNCLMRALSIRGMLNLISSRELDVIYKCFSIERAGNLGFDYRAFLRALRLLQENKTALPL
ncbi:PREDICTED: uncharacterized protein LOC106786514 [Polistes canadensis]|uniref:uncharacterized protein LOC106786514 n=1 Tax=Polistes canadensis TaxID=91411 RepID=UPI000718BB42|nr:PREDICTED: uncharacterized protein LOC106786514 [Polistes canadensis]